VHRVYCALRLNLPRRTTRRVPRRVRQPLAAPPVLNRTWALDFMTETLYDGRRVRLLTMIDEGNREGLEIAMGLSLPSRRVIRVLDELVAVHGCPFAFRVDNGPEFTAQTFVDWCAEHQAAIHYIQPGKPDQNAYIERFNRSYRTEVLNAHLFESVAELRALTDTGCGSTTANGPMTASAGCRRSRFCRGQHQPNSLSSRCLLDGEAYGMKRSCTPWA
jgi:putative transposase